MATQTKRTTRTSSAAADFFTELEAAPKSFLTEDEKQQLADEERPFTVVSVELTSSKQYGDRWELEVLPADGKPFPFDHPVENRVIFTLPSHGARDYIMRKLAKAVESTPVGPLSLTITDLDDGKTWMALKKAQA